MLVVIQQVVSFALEFIVLIVKICWSCVETVYQGVVGRPKKPLVGEVVLVTGAGRGLGRELSLEFARRKAIVVLWDINEKSIARVKSEIECEGGTSHAYRCDVSNIEEVNRIGTRVLNEVGDVTIAVNNAGVLQNVLFTELDVDRIRKTIDVNLLAHFWVNRFFLPKMMERKKGHIVAISSAGGLCGWRYLADYSATKFGIVGMMEVLEEEMRLMGLSEAIQFTTVCPITMDTGMNQKPTSKYPFLFPIMDVQESAQLIIDSVQSNDRIITVPRRVLMPLLLSKVLPKKVSNTVQDFLQYNLNKNSQDYWNRIEENGSCMSF